MTDRELKQMALPCPFCGGKDISTHEGSTFRWHVAECMTCGAQGSEVRRQTFGQGTTELWIKQAAADAIAEWNTRAALAQPEPDDGYCQACDGNNCTAKDGCVARDNPIAQPEPEPVAWDDAPTKIYLQICDDVDCDLSFEAHDDVSWCQDKINDCDVAYVRADTAPPQREWQGLTDEEIGEIADDEGYGYMDVARAIQAKLKEKNATYL